MTDPLDPCQDPAEPFDQEEQDRRNEALERLRRGPEFEDLGVGDQEGLGPIDDGRIDGGLPIEVEERIVLVSQEELARRLAVERLQNSVERATAISRTTPITYPGYDDVFLEDSVYTRRYVGMYSAGKSTWLMNDSTLLGRSITFDLDQEAKFFSKPQQLIYTRYPNDFATMPSPLPNPIDFLQEDLDIHDSLKFVSDKTWYNVRHLQGPVETANPGIMKQHHRKDTSADFYFINRAAPAGKLFIPDGTVVWGVFHEVYESYFCLVTDDDIRSGLVLDADQWLNLGEALDRHFRESQFSTDSLRLGYNLEAHKIALRQMPYLNWTEYFNGYIPPDRIAPNANVSLGVMRALSSQIGNSYHWRFIGDIPPFPASPFLEIPMEDRIAIDPLNKRLLMYNRNIWPVIPFFGVRDDLEGQDPLSPFTVSRLPSVGQHVLRDHVTNVPDIISKEEADHLDLANQTYYDIRPVYSYYDCLYETIFSPVLNERELPSFYIRRPTELSALQNMEELNEMRQSVAQSIPNFDNSGRLDDPDYALRLAQAMSEYYGFNISQDEIPAEPSEIHISSLEDSALEEIYNQRMLNPMFVEIELGNVQKSQFSEAMTFGGNSGLLRILIKDVLNNGDRRFVIGGRTGTATDKFPVGFSYVNEIVESGLQPIFDLDGPPQELPLGQVTTTSDTFPLEAKVIDFEKWFNFYSQVDSMGFSNRIEHFAAVFQMMIIRSRLNNLINESHRTYPQMMNGVPARSEVIGYTVEKHKVKEDGTTEHITTFTILNNNDRLVRKFYDSQVKYGEIYEYKINRIVVVYGMKYVYVDSNSEKSMELFRESSKPLYGRSQNDVNERGAYVSYGVIHKPEVILTTLPTAVKRTAVLDHPPVFPDVNIIPFKNEHNKLLINLSSNGGEFSAPPIVLEDDDVLQFVRSMINQGLADDAADAFSLGLSLLANSQGVTQPDGSAFDVPMVKFKSDDPTTVFEIFRIEEYPTSYDDFRGNKIKRITGKADNAACIDNIQHNKKYYYTFRTEDIHGHVSNPSHIYEVELIKHNDAVYLDMNIVEPMNIKEIRKRLRQSSKDLRHFLMIKPSIPQRTLQLPEDGTYESFVAGNEDGAVPTSRAEPVWGRKFKLRVRSKHTGKEIDINFRIRMKVRRDDENKKENLIC